MVAMAARATTRMFVLGPSSAAASLSGAADAAIAARSARASASALDLSSASRTASIAAALAGMSFSWGVTSAGSAPLSSAAARAAHPASETWVLSRSSLLSFFSPPVVYCTSVLVPQRF